MSGTIFDLIEDEISTGKEGYFELAKKAPEPKDDSFLNTVKDYGKTILKGTVEGLGKFGRMMGPLQSEKPTSQQLEEQTESLDVLLPTDEGFIQRGLRRGLREAPSMAAFPGAGAQAIPRTLAAGFVGEGAKDLGAPEWAQSALELTTYVGPDITKKLLEKGNNAELISYAKKFGMSDNEIAPLIQSEFKQKWLSKLAPRKGGTEKALRTTKDALSEAYTSIKKSPEATSVIPQQAQDTLMKSFKDLLSEMPSAVRKKIQPDLKDFVNGPRTGESLINLYSDIGHSLGPQTKQLSLLKQPIKDALIKVSPELGKDFEMVNKLHTKYYPIAGKLKPTISSDIVSAVETLSVIGGTLGAFLGHYPSLLAIMGEQAAKKVAQQMLINPRFQQLGEKMMVAVNQNKYGLAKKLTEDLRKEISKFSPESASKIQDFSEEDFKDLLKGHQSEKD